MKRRFLVPSMLPLLLGVFALITGATPQEAKKTEPEEVAQKCLECHGPYDKLAAATADFTTASGETATPHQYVPHADKKDIPDCTFCHTPHPVPLDDKSKVVKPTDVEWCYTSCHHAANLQPCSNCH